MTLDMGTTIFSKLRGIVDDRVYPDVAPADIDFTKSYIVYKVSTIGVQRDIQQNIVMASFDISVICFHTEKDLATTLGSDIISALDGKDDIPNSVKVIEFTGRQSEYEPDGDLWAESISFNAIKI